MKKNMVYAILSVRVRMAMWNAAFTKYAKQNSVGEMYASSQALGYAIKEQLNRDGFDMLYRKKINEEGVMSLKDVFESKTGATPKELKTENQIKKVLFENFNDIIHFGTVFAAKPYTSFGICGPVQIGIGQNKFMDTEHVINEMMPCFSAENAKKARSNEDDDKPKSNTLGEQVVLDKAHFVYDVTISPYQYEEMAKTIDGFKGYTEENYQQFKMASIKAVSNLNSKAKKGCTNEFALFVETKDDVRDSIDLNCLSEYVKVSEENDVIIYNIEGVANVLNAAKGDIKSIEVYYDHRTMKLIGDIDNAKYFDIRTRKVL